jgi:acetyl-CoA synthetase
MQKANSYCKPEIMNSEDIMFILYTSGTTGKPKGIVHDIGGYAVQSYWTAKWNFNLHDDDVMWCTADIGWITGHTYAFYGPLLNGMTSLIYEGSPDYPNMGRWWDIIEQNNVTVFYTAPTAIRMFMMSGEKYLKRRKLEKLRILATVGEPIDKKAWNWYFKNVGKSRCPIIDTWWQTETGGTLINVLPGVGPFVPMVAGLSFPGTNHEVVDKNGKKVKGNTSGFLVQVSPYAPGMLHGVYNNHEKYVKTYWSTFDKKYDTSDGGFYVDGGLIRVTGRTDDVMKVAGHRLATAELENAINGCKIVNESAVVSMPDQIKGEVPIAFVVLKKKLLMGGDLEKKIKMHVDKAIGPTARPAKVYFVNELPKTRSGKIMRRILKNIIHKEEPAGLMTLVNPGSVDEIKMVVEKGK